MTTQHEPKAQNADEHLKTPRRARVPGFNSETEVGLGDVIKRVTSFAGIQPCGPCRKRAVRLNHWLVFGGRR